MSLCKMSLVELRQGLGKKTFKCEDIIADLFARIEKRNPKINGWISLSETAMDEARRVDKRIAKGEPLRALEGLPLGMKDLICVKGMKTTAASRMLANFVAPYSATLAEKLDSAGAIILGKTNLDEFAMGSSNETSYFGECKNPWNLVKTPGGSSGGSAAVVAGFEVPAAIGTDTGGSIRQPAHYCGVVGVKPTYGRISRYGIVAYASSLDQAGPMTRTVSDGALLLDSLCGYDTFDSTSSSKPVPSWSQSLQSDVSGLKIGVLKEFMEMEMSSDIRKACLGSIAELEKAGAKIVNVSAPSINHTIPVYYLIAMCEASSNLARYDGVRYGHRAKSSIETSDLAEFYKSNRGEGFGEEVQRRILLGTYALSAGYYEAFYLKACQIRRKIRDEYVAIFNSCDVIVGPVSSGSAFSIGEKITDPLLMYANDVFTASVNLAGLPAMSLPVQLDSTGLPIGVQIIAKHFNEQAIFGVGKRLEEAFDFSEVASGLF